MIVCVDVDYRDHEVAAACVGFADWRDAAAARELVVKTAGPPPSYESGAFYKRELPYVTGVVAAFGAADTIVVDGYVWLAPGQPGLGWHVHAALGVPVIGVAKRPFATAEAIAVRRGASASPLFVTAVGTDAAAAAAAIAAMHGAFRLPTLLKRVDRLCRDA